MKTKISFIVVSVFMMVALGAGIALAKRSCFSVIANLPDLELKNDQKARLEKKETEHCKKMIRLRADLSIAKLEKKKLITDKNFKASAVRKQIEKIMSVKRDIQMARLDALTEIRDVLTDEQWTGFSSHIKNICNNKPCFQKSPDCGRQMKGKHHRRGHRGKGFDCGMGFGQNRDDCLHSFNRMRMEE